MKLAVCVSIRQLTLLHVHYASSFEAPCHSGVFPGELLLAVPNDEFRARLRLVGHKVLVRCQVTVTVGVSVRIGTTIGKSGSK